MHLLVQRGLTIAVAESLTGGLLVAELIKTPGASAAVLGGVVAYDTELKHTLLDVDAELLAEVGPVHPEVARQMALGVRRPACRTRPGARMSGSARPVSPGRTSQGGAAVGTVFVGLAVVDRVEVAELHLAGDRAAIRRGRGRRILVTAGCPAPGIGVVSITLQTVCSPATHSNPWLECKYDSRT